MAGHFHSPHEEATMADGFVMPVTSSPMVSTWSSVTTRTRSSRFSQTGT